MNIHSSEWQIFFSLCTNVVLLRITSLADPDLRAFESLSGYIANASTMQDILCVCMPHETHDDDLLHCFAILVLLV